MAIFLSKAPLVQVSGNAIRVNLSTPILDTIIAREKIVDRLQIFPDGGPT